MPILEKFTKQPADVQDYDIDFNPWLSKFTDTGATLVVAADAGLTILTSTLVAGIAKIWTSGGTDGASYKITATVTSTGNRVKQADIVVKVKES